MTPLRSKMLKLMKIHLFLNFSLEVLVNPYSHVYTVLSSDYLFKSSYRNHDKNFSDYAMSRLN